MKTRFLILITTVLIVLNSQGQSNNNRVIDSTKIKIIGNSIYKIHHEYFKSQINGNIQTDSIEFRLVKMNLENILFRKSKSEILQESIDDLDELTTLLRDNPKVQLHINGYSDRGREC